MGTTKVRVLMVGCPASIAHLVRETLARATGGPFEVAHVHRISEALNHLGRAPADVVLLESTVPDASGLDGLARLTRAVTGVRVVLLVRPSEITLAQHALAGGAFGYLVKDDLWELDTARLVRAIEGARRVLVAPALADAAARPAPRPVRRARTLAFLGVRGGTGTTSLALDTALIAHSRGLTVALVELRPSPGGLPGLLAIDAARHLGQLTAAREPASIDRVLTDVKPGLKVLFAPRDAAHAELEADDTQAMLDALATMFDVVVLDLPRDGSPATQMGAQRASFLSLVMDPDPACVRQARACVAAISAWSVQETRVGLVVVHRPRSIDVPLGTLREKLGTEIIGVVPIPAGHRLAPLPGLAARGNEATDTLVLSLVNLTDRLLKEDVAPLRTQA